MLYSKKTDYLMESIRLGREIGGQELQSYCRVEYTFYAGSDFYGDDVLH